METVVSPDKTKKTVLVVDDEPHVRSFVRIVLSRQGYEVLEAEDGVEALEVVEQHADEIEFLVTDVKMPRMDGITLGERIGAGYPAIPVLYMSAYIPSAPKGVPSRRFLTKPFRPDALVNCIRSLS